MAPIFRYRYVDFGTSFTGDLRERGLESGTDEPGTLFANSLAIDVGGTCWDVNEPLPIIDHHFQRESQFPSASAAVLHKAGLIRERFANRQVVWLVTHKEPDFDAFCSMYLARWIIAAPSPPLDFRQCGLDPNGWLDLPHRPKVEWFNPDVAGVPAEHRWALLLASYASLLESRRPISCPRQRALRSVLYAALKRGRDYLSESSGATEFFDEVRAVLQAQPLNPAYDSVLEQSALFAPELVMLDREAAAYQRDMRRARRSIVYLPQSEAPSPDFFKDPRQMAFHDQRRASDLDAEHLLLADTFRIPTDAIYLRDPECLLFKEWARLDIENSTLGAGFEFTAIADSNGRPDAPSNKTEYQFSIDPERTNGRHLYTVWSRLQTQEVEALREHDQRAVVVGAGSHHASSRGTATLGSLLADPWIGGQSQYGNRVAVPQRGTLLGPPGTRSDLRDDPVAEAVRTELENSIYSAASLVAGPQVTVHDLAGAKEGVDIAPQHYDLNAPLEIPAPPETYFRFAALRLRADVPINQPHLAQQIGETLWQVLYPDMPGSTPSDFAEKHLVVTGDSVGVWGDRGVGIALKGNATTSGTERQMADLRGTLVIIVSLVRDIDRFFDHRPAIEQPTQNVNIDELRRIAGSSGELSAREVHMQHVLKLPDREIFRAFYEGNDFEKLMSLMRGWNFAAIQRMRSYEDAEQTRRLQSHFGLVSELQKQLDWLQFFTIGFLAVILIDVLISYTQLGSTLKEGLAFLGAPLVFGIAAWTLKPWQRKKIDTIVAGSRRPSSASIILAVASALGWMAGLFQLWKK